MCGSVLLLLVASVMMMAAAAAGHALGCGRHVGCRLTGGSGRTLMFEVDGKEISISTDSIIFIKVECNGLSVLESPGLPRAEPPLNVSQVTLHRCPLPAGNRSLADSLAALDVKLKYNSPPFHLGMLSLDELPPEPPLAATHFAGLESIAILQIRAEKGTRMSPKRSFLADLRNLTLLKTMNVTLHADEIDALPSLNQLVLEDPRMERLPEPQGLKMLRLSNWMQLRPAPLARCDELRKLHLPAPSVHALPEGWLANCFILAELVIHNARYLTTLPMRLFGGSHNAIMFLAFKQGVLNTLPARWLEYTPLLHTLELDDNDLDGRALTAIAHHTELDTLDLRHNMRIGDICDKNGYSPISNLTKLKFLFLNGTNLTRICRDWRQNMTLLKKLDLSDTRVSELSFEDLQFMRVEKATVLLLGAPVVVVTKREEFNNPGFATKNNTVVYINATLQCDCRMYWTRRILERLELDHIRNLHCTTGNRDSPRALSDVPPEDMVCPRPQECKEAKLPDACTCAARPDDDPAQNRRLVRVHCENASLAHIPHPQAPASPPPRLYELLLAHNRITSLFAEQLQNIKGLDLRNNSLKTVDEETAMKLSDIGGVLRLANNPLECSCRAAPLLRALLHRTLTGTDLANATCSDGSAFNAAPIADCLSYAAAIRGLAVLSALTVTACIVCLVLRNRRYFTRAVQDRCSCLWCSTAPEENDDRYYDAFVTFSHKDEAVMLELLAKLEPPYRLCVHQRDWIPGLRIPDQIVDSVRKSRRTVALVSRHFLSSMWTRVEFREAHTAAMIDARARLVVVMLEDPSALEMDDQLQRYITTHTYLRWGEPRFWRKLTAALPRPRHPRVEQLVTTHPVSSTPLALLSSPMLASSPS